MCIAEPLTRFTKEFREDRISMQEIEMLRSLLYQKGVLSGYEMEELNKLPMMALTRCNQVYQLLYYLDQKSDGAFMLIESLQEMKSDRNWLGEIADTLISEYCKFRSAWEIDHSISISINF